MVESRSGIVQPKRVLQDVQRPEEGYRSHQIEPVQTDILASDVPIATQVTAQKMAFLRHQLEEETQSLGKGCKLRVEKGSNAAENLFAELAMLNEENRFAV